MQECKYPGSRWHMDTKRSYSKTDIKDVKLADEYGVNPLDYVDISLINIGLSIGAINNLMKEGVHTVCDLLNLTENELYGIKNIGKRSIEIIREALEDIFKSDRKALVRRSFDIIVDGRLHSTYFQFRLM
jgi:DNA-directed RNA polymerase alpha subunit